LVARCRKSKERWCGSGDGCKVFGASKASSGFSGEIACTGKIRDNEFQIVEVNSCDLTQIDMYFNALKTDESRHYIVDMIAK